MYFTVSLLVLAAPGAGVSHRQVGAGGPVSTSVRAGKAFSRPPVLAFAFRGAGCRRRPYGGSAVRSRACGRAPVLRRSGAPMGRNYRSGPPRGEPTGGPG